MCVWLFMCACVKITSIGFNSMVESRVELKHWRNAFNTQAKYSQLSFVHNQLRRNLEYWKFAVTMKDKIRFSFWSSEPGNSNSNYETINMVKPMNSHNYYFAVEVERRLITPIHQEKIHWKKWYKSLIERFNICADCVYTNTSYMIYVRLRFYLIVRCCNGSLQLYPCRSIHNAYSEKERERERGRMGGSGKLFNALQWSAILNYGCHKDIKVYGVASVVDAAAPVFVAFVVAFVVSTDVPCIYIAYYVLDKCGCKITNNRSDACVSVYLGCTSNRAKLLSKLSFVKLKKSQLFECNAPHSCIWYISQYMMLIHSFINTAIKM